MGLFKNLHEAQQRGATDNELYAKIEPMLRLQENGQPQIPDREFSLLEMAMHIPMPANSMHAGENLFEYLRNNPVGDSRLLSEALNSSMFPILGQARLAGSIQAAYDDVPDVAGQFVGSLGNPNQKNPSYANLSRARGMKEYFEEGNWERKEDIDGQAVSGKRHKYATGVNITKEAIMDDQTGQLLSRATDIGRDAAEHRQQNIFETIVDINTTALYKNGSNDATALYNTTAWAKNTWPLDNMIISNPLTNYEDAMEKIKLNLFRKKDRKGNKINVVSGRGLMLIQPANEKTCKILRESNGSPGTANNDANVARGLTGDIAGTWDYVTSPYFDNTTTTGNIKANDYFFSYRWQDQFKELTWWPMTISTLGTGSQAEFDRDILYQYKISHAFQIIATDYVYVIKCRAEAS